MLYAFDTITCDRVSAEEVSKNNIDEPFRYECLCCGEEVHLAAARSKKRSPHFRHLRGNRAKDCELYLGGLFKTGAEIERALAAAEKRARSHAEILFNPIEHLFYFSISFSEEKIAEYQNAEYELSIKSGSSQLLNPVLLNRANFAPDSPVLFPLRLTSNFFCLSLRSRKMIGNPIVSNYELLKPIDFPTFFKFQTKYDESPITKRHTDGIIYTDTRYYIIAMKKSSIEKLLYYSPCISIGQIEEIAALGSVVFGAELVITSLSSELRDTMQYFGYFLRKLERITLLWPPYYFVNGELRCKEGTLFLASSAELKPRSNITCNFDQLTNSGDLYTINYSDSLRIRQTNGTEIQISTPKDILPISKKEPTTEVQKTIVVGEGQNFFCFGKNGCSVLAPGRYHLTVSSRIVQYLGNYPDTIYTLPDNCQMSAEKKLSDILKYYNVMIPFTDDLIHEIQLSSVAESYIAKCRNAGTINVKALESIKAGTI